MIRIKFFFFKIKKITVKDDKEFLALYNAINPSSFEDFIKKIIEGGYLERFLKIILKPTLWTRLLEKLGLKVNYENITNDELVKAIQLFFTKNSKSIEVLTNLSRIILIINMLMKEK